jgi:hypothetical protein
MMARLLVLWLMAACVAGPVLGAWIRAGGGGD